MDSNVENLLQVVQEELDTIASVYCDEDIIQREAMIVKVPKFTLFNVVTAAQKPQQEPEL
jgi:hypothetical protein